jgi:hypothetical protein
MVQWHMLVQRDHSGQLSVAAGASDPCSAAESATVAFTSLDCVERHAPADSARTKSHRGDRMSFKGGSFCLYGAPPRDGGRSASKRGGAQI